MKLVVLFCAVVITFLGASGEPVVYGNITGQTSGREDYPYVVHLEITDLQIQSTFTCGGTILSGRVVLTAAHCFSGTSGDLEAYVIAGILHLTKEIKKAQIGKMYDYLMHENYVAGSTYKDNHGNIIGLMHPNDIGIVWTEKHLMYNEKIRHIELTKPNLNIVDKKGFILGWGQTEIGTCSNILRRADLRVLPNNDCENYSNGVYYLLTKGMLCIKADDEKSLQCKGDSGGPFIVGNKIAGIISRSSKSNKILPNGKEIRTSDPEHGAVATNVGFYYDWINDNMKLGPPKNRKKKQTKPNTTSKPGRPGKPDKKKKT